MRANNDLKHVYCKNPYTGEDWEPGEQAPEPIQVKRRTRPQVVERVPVEESPAAEEEQPSQEQKPEE